MRFIFFIFFVLGIVTTQIFSHSGRTNSQGCHTGDQYHCHQGNSGNNNQGNTSDAYNRKEWKFYAKKSPYHDSKVGYYTGLQASETDVDHVVALRDAHDSGGWRWQSNKKRQFANDSENHVPALAYVNRVLKKHFGPKKFISKMQQSTYQLIRKCGYLKKYTKIKQKYKLSFANNNLAYIQKSLQSCNLGNE